MILSLWTFLHEKFIFLDFSCKKTAKILISEPINNPIQERWIH